MYMVKVKVMIIHQMIIQSVKSNAQSCKYATTSCKTEYDFRPYRNPNPAFGMKNTQITTWFELVRYVAIMQQISMSDRTKGLDI